MSEAILALNAGSSSVKLALFAVEPGWTGGAGAALAPLAHGEVEGIGDAPHFFARDAAGRTLAERRWSARRADPAEAFLSDLLDFADRHAAPHSLTAIGHRVVHGGPEHAGPARVTPALIDDLDALTPLAPLHQPHSLAPMREIARLRPSLAQVACFDTAFHHTMPKVAQRLALPRDVANPPGGLQLRRYGFHGLSYEHIARELRATAPDVARGKLIVAHLGSGASLCALRDGQSVETTMSMTALDGLVMGTRCGAIDPGVILHLIGARGMSAGDVEAMLYHRSGLLGVSGISADMRKLHASGAPAAREAIELFVYRLTAEIGRLAAALGGLDGLVFTAGVGEHDAEIRAAACARLGWLGISLDEAANKAAARRISVPNGAVAVEVIPADEERMIALHTAEVLGIGKG